MDFSAKTNKINKLRDQIAQCTRCELHQTRTNTVPGEGDVDAKILFIGEAPGRNEDEKGIPFAGRAGGILDQLLESVGIKRENIYICNILKCRPPSNRNPLASEISSCIGSLDLQLKIIDPVVIGTLGNFATTYVFNKFGLPESKIGQVHGKVFEVDSEFGKKKIVPLYHPAVATYNIHKLPELMDDFAVFKQFLNVNKEPAGV